MDARRPSEAPLAKSLFGGWMAARTVLRRRTRGSVALNGIEEEPALKLTQIVIRLPCARPSRQTHPRELPEDILGRRRATTHQQLPRWCGNAAQTS